MHSRVRHMLVTGAGGRLGKVFIKLLAERQMPYRTYDWRRPGEVPEGVDAVAHFGGLVPRTDAASTPAHEFHTANVEGTAALLSSLSERSGLLRFVNISSASEYGYSEEILRENTPLAPANAYGKSKVAQASLVEAFAREQGVPSCNLRIFNIIGSEFPLHRQVAEAFRRDEGTVQIAVRNRDDIRDFVDVRDVARAVLSTLEGEQEAIYENCNVSSGIGTTIEDLVAMYASCAGRSYAIRDTADVPTRSVGDPHKIRKLFGWQPQISLHDAVQDVMKEEA